VKLVLELVLRLMELLLLTWLQVHLLLTQYSFLLSLILLKLELLSLLYVL
jgi:hypothetical protein